MLCGYLQFKSFFVVYKEAQVGGAGGGGGGGGHGLKGPGFSLLVQVFCGPNLITMDK
jgi:hypothetical protein